MVSEVIFPGFWGVFRSIKVVSVFRFGDRKCRFRDMAIRAFLRKELLELKRTLKDVVWEGSNGFSNLHICTALCQLVVLQDLC